MRKWIIVFALLGISGLFCGPAAALKNSIEELKALEPNQGEINYKLSRYLRQERYDEIEMYLEDLNTRRPINHGGFPILEGVYYDLGRYRDNVPYLQKWCESRNHHSAYIARGIYYKGEAWQARGSDSGYTVSQEHRDLFRQKLKQAAADFEKAYRMNNQDPNSACQMLVICRGLGWPKSDTEKWFQRAVTADPLAYYPYFNKLNYLSPKWHGSIEEHTRFAQECYSNPIAGSMTYTLVLD